MLYEVITLLVFHRIWLGNRLPYQRHRWRQLWCLYRSGTHHAVAINREHLQRIFRNLPAEIHGYDLRGAFCTVV